MRASSTLLAAASAAVAASSVIVSLIAAPRITARAATPMPAASVSPIDPVVHDCNITPPNTPITSALLTSGLPCAATIIPPGTLENIQHGFDYYSWLTFLSLNAPANGSAPIGKGSGPGGDASTVWEHWQDITNTIPPKGGKPPVWGKSMPPPAVCERAGATRGSSVVQMIAKLPDVQETVQPFDDGPLIDQSGNYTRYQILVNRPMFEYIFQNNLYDKAGQKAFAGAIDFPSGAVENGTAGTIGAIMIKAAWKILDGTDSPTHFHTMLAYVYTPPSDNPKIAASCVKKTLALVGLHVVHKTVSDPQWVWSTYEHIDNDPTADEVKAGTVQDHYNYYNRACNTTKCPVNTVPPRPWNPNQQPFPDGFTSQIARVIGLQPDAQKLNDAYRDLLAGTVWYNYRLISTQWPTKSNNPTDPTGAPAPQFLANTTMETYIQGRVPNVSSSCIRCHNIATDTAQKNADFTYILSRAK
jgi:hypothetical protein